MTTRALFCFLLALPLALASLFSPASRAHGEAPPVPALSDILPEIPARAYFEQLELTVFDQEAGWLRPRAGDFNGDGRADVLIPDENMDRLVLLVWAATADGKHIFIQQEWQPLAESQDLDMRWEHAAVVDFNRDGADDLFFPTEQRERFVIAISDKARSFETRELKIPYAPARPVRIHAGNVENDGYPDFYLQDEQSHYTWTFHSEAETGNTTYRTWVQAVPGGELLLGMGRFYLPKDHPYFSMLDGMMFSGTTSKVWRLWYPVESGEPRQEIYAELPIQAPGKVWALGDLNGDGRTDLIAYAGKELGWWIAIANGKTAIEISIASPFPLFRYDSPLEARDFNGDGLTDLLEARVRAGSLRFAFGNKTAWSKKEDFGIGGAVSLAGDEHGPFVCLGYSPNGYPRKWGRNSICPAGYAYYETEGLSSRNIQGNVHLSGTCCRLPSGDILLDEHRWVVDECPENFVATGAMGSFGCRDCLQQMRCTKLNTERYSLGAEGSGFYWGTGLSMRRNRTILPRSAIPVAMRGAVGRLRYNVWEAHGCIAVQAGSLLVRKGINRCHEHRFRELVYTGQPDDPVAGTPVQMMPRCSQLLNVFDPRAGCKPAKK